MAWPSAVAFAVLSNHDRLDYVHLVLKQILSFDSS